MSESNRTYRIKANVGVDTNLNINLEQDYDTFEILSLKLGQEDIYRLHTSNYGVVVGRVLANNGFGVENAKISIFISADTETMSKVVESQLYPYRNISDKNEDGRRYNLLNTDEIDDCHTVVGSFPSKSYLLDNDVLLEIFDKYYKYTVRTNHAGDYMICGVPVGQQVLHMDLDLSDCGILSQRPRDFVYQGYTIEQFENANQFKGGSELDTLSQVFSQDISIDVIPFWGDSTQGETIGITREDINVNFTFQPTCVFMGSVVGDNASNGFSQKGVPTNNMGAMDELTTGEGTIEMIRKTPMGTVEEFQVKGTEVINGDGVWCYQIPMNLDYVMHDEYGNIVPTNNPNKGIPTRTKVRFRVSMHEFESSQDGYYRAKVLVPHNPKYESAAERDMAEDKYGDILDYNFGSNTDDNSFRDLFWNNVYTVKSYIPRVQKSQFFKFTPTERFTGIKHTNIYGQNNPMPYNNIRIRLPLMFTILCALIKSYIRVVQFINGFINVLMRIIDKNIFILDKRAKGLTMVVLADGLCPDLEGWYFAPTTYLYNVSKDGIDPLKQTFDALTEGVPVEGNYTKDVEKFIVLIESTWEERTEAYGTVVYIVPEGYDTGNISEVEIKDGKVFKYGGGDVTQELMYKFIPNSYVAKADMDKTSIDSSNSNPSEDNNVCLTTNIDYLLSCVEMNLAQEYKVVNFDFYNDWVNGTIYMPRWRRIQRGKTLFRILRNKPVIKGFMSADSENLDPQGKATGIKYKTTATTAKKYTQQCSMSYELKENTLPKLVYKGKGCSSNKVNKQECHKARGTDKVNVFGRATGGAVHAARTFQNEFVYYFKPCEWFTSENYTKRINLFANDIVLLGSLNDCSIDGIPQAFKYLTSTSYKMPTNLALTNMESDGYLYAIAEGNNTTICGGHHTTSTGPGNMGSISEASVGSNTWRNLETKGVGRVPNTFTAMQSYTEGTDNQINYADVDDYVPLTEAPGISWNYSGPDQGHTALTETEAIANGTTVEKLGYIKGFYQPGGLFLGLSCINSETNIKSCINLSRICEMGVDLPSRKEMPIGTKDDYLRYKYLVPTGLVSLDDIASTDFRAMFATLNHKKLIARKLASNTISKGDDYFKYEFYYLRPNNFNGEFREWVADSDYYNAHLTAGKEFVVETNLLGSLINQPDVKAEVEDVTGNTYRRTMEAASLDYYKFRLGIDDLSTASQRAKYLTSSGVQGAFALPQYENSFYFYFGLHEGATALDELNKEFFSTCVKKNNDISEEATNPVTDTYIIPSSANLSKPSDIAVFTIVTSEEGNVNWRLIGDGTSHVSTAVDGNSYRITYNSYVAQTQTVTVRATIGDETADALLTLESSSTPITRISISPSSHTFGELNVEHTYTATTNSNSQIVWSMMGNLSNYCSITPVGNVCTVRYNTSTTEIPYGQTKDYYLKAAVEGVSAQTIVRLKNTHDDGGESRVDVTPGVYTASTTGTYQDFTAVLSNVSGTPQWSLNGGSGYASITPMANNKCRLTYNNYVSSDTVIYLTANVGGVEGMASITLKKESVVPPTPTGDYTVWLKDAFHSGDYVIAGDNITWTSPAQYSFDVAMTGPIGSRIFPEIDRGFVVYTTEEELITRGPRIAFNHIRPIPQTLQGGDTKVLIGDGLSPGSAAAAGYSAYLQFRNENNEIVKRIHIEYPSS